ncbi:MAG: YdcF family protein [Bacteroidota bacterium]
MKQIFTYNFQKYAPLNFKLHTWMEAPFRNAGSSDFILTLFIQITSSMFFYLSQFLSFLAMPLTLVILALLAAFYFTPKSTGKKILGAGIVLLLLFSNPFLSNLALLTWEPPYKSFEEIPPSEIGIVLTGVTNLNKTAPDRTFFGRGADRITHALQLYRMGKIQKILITGGQGLNPTNSYSEAELLKRFLIMTGMPEADILIEEKSLNTRENALFTKEFLEKEKIATQQEFILITSAFHIPRAKACFDQVGLKTIPFPVDYYSHDPKYDIPSLIYPSLGSLETWQILIKEFLGLLMYQIVGYI